MRDDFDGSDRRVARSNLANPRPAGLPRWRRRGASDRVAVTAAIRPVAEQAFEGCPAGDRGPLRARRNVLEDVLGDQQLVLPARRLADDGLKAWQDVVTRGYEGLVAKDPVSPDVGGRTLKWLKVKQPHYREGERGWEPSRKS